MVAAEEALGCVTSESRSAWCSARVWSLTAACEDGPRSSWRTRAETTVGPPGCTSSPSAEWRPSEPRPGASGDVHLQDKSRGDRMSRRESYSQVSAQPVGGAVLALHPVTEARPGRPDVLIRPLSSEDPLIQTAGSQNVFLIEPAERQSEEAKRGNMFYLLSSPFQTNSVKFSAFNVDLLILHNVD